MTSSRGYILRPSSLVLLAVTACHLAATISGQVAYFAPNYKLDEEFPTPRQNQTISDEEISSGFSGLSSSTSSSSSEDFSNFNFAELQVTAAPTLKPSNRRSMLADHLGAEPTSRSPYFDVFEPEADEQLIPVADAETDEYFIAEVSGLSPNGTLILNLTSPSSSSSTSASTSTSTSTQQVTTPSRTTIQDIMKPCLEIDGRQYPIRSLLDKKGDDGVFEEDSTTCNAALCRKVAAEEIDRRMGARQGLQSGGGCKGIKGEKGEPSMITFTIGMPGPKGEKGDSTLHSHSSGRLPNQRVVKGEKGEPGPPGPSVEKPAHFGTMIFAQKSDLRQQSNKYPVGTLAFIVDEQSLMVKTTLSSWRVVLLGATDDLLEESSERAPSSAMRQEETAGEMNLDDSFTTDTERHWPAVISSPRLHLAAIDFTVSGQLGGITAYDDLCESEAARLGVAGTYQAFMSSHFVSLRSLISMHQDLSVPIVNIKNQKLFNNWPEIFNGQGGSLLDSENQRHHHHLPTIYTFGGYDIFKNAEQRFQQSERFIWHGSNSSGHTVHTSYCASWRQHGRLSKGRGSPIDGRHRTVLSEHDYDCSRHGVLLCIEVTTRYRATTATSAKKRPHLQKSARNLLDDGRVSDAASVRQQHHRRHRHHRRHPAGRRKVKLQNNDKPQVQHRQFIL